MPSLKDLGYQYVPAAASGDEGLREADLVLRQVGNPSKGFEWRGQEDYDRLGEAVAAYLREQLVTTYKMQAKNVGTDPKQPVEVYYRDLENETVCVLIQGSGAVTPGMWARSLCINNSLHEGTVFPYIRAAVQRGWGVLVANPNAEGNVCAEAHVGLLFKTFIHPSPARNVVAVAHSYGGCDMLYYLKTAAASDLSKLRCIAFTDSVHKLRQVVPSDADVAAASKPNEAAARQKRLRALREAVPEAFDEPSTAVLTFLKEKTRNWVESALPLGTPTTPPIHEGVSRVSSGHTDHVWTSGTAFTDVFSFLDAVVGERDRILPEKLGEAARHKEAGNLAMKEKNYKKASMEYKKALIWLRAVVGGDGPGGDAMMQMADNLMKKKAKAPEKSAAELQMGKTLEASVKNNLAQARLRLEDWAGAATYASEVLLLEPGNVKARFRRGQACLHMGDLNQAREDLAMVQKVEPSTVEAALKTLRAQEQKLREKEKKAFSSMFK